MRDIREHYKVPAKQGARVRRNGKRGRVTIADGGFVRVLWEGAKRSTAHHPTELEWLKQ